MKHAPLAELIRLRSYSRLNDDTKETWEETCQRTIYSPHGGIAQMGNLTPDETELVYRMQRDRIAFGSARMLWVGGTEWFSQPQNFAGGFNCSSYRVIDWNTFGMLMDLAMMGCGTGAGVDLESIANLPTIINKLNVTVIGQFGLYDSVDDTLVIRMFKKSQVVINVGDSRKGWVDAYQAFLELSSDDRFATNEINVVIDISHIRPVGTPLKGFGGTANPHKFPEMWDKLATVLNGANGRKLNSMEVCLLLNEAALVVVAGNIRRGASIQLGSSEDDIFKTAKDNLWQQDNEGNWKIDPMRDSLRMANHTRLFFHKPTLDEIKEAVTKQFYSGEGAIMYAPESIARCNADLLNTPDKKSKFLEFYQISKDKALGYLEGLNGAEFDDYEAHHRMHRYLGNPCFAAGTMIVTRDGNLPIETLVGKVVDVWDGNQWVTINNFRVTGENKNVYKLTLKNGSFVIATLGHNFVLSDGTKVEMAGLKQGDILKASGLWGDAKDQDFIVDRVEFSHIADKVYCCTVPTNNCVALSIGLLTGQCMEVLGNDFFCDLASVHLNQIDPFDFETQEQAFRASALQAASFLNRGFINERQEKSRQLDPIVLVSFTGAFTFFVKSFGVDWLKWWQAGRPDKWGTEEQLLRLCDKEFFFEEYCGNFRFVSDAFEVLEQWYLSHWREIVETTVWEYCDRHGLKRPNRCTGIKPEGSMTLLSGVGCNGHHAPKSWRYIRRMTFAANDPIALAAMDYGYSVVPGQADKDDEGRLLNDPFDPRCTEWLVEVPVEEEIVSLYPDAESIDPSQFSALAQFDWLMQVQKHYTTFNTSTTLEFKADEIETLSQRIYDAIQNDEGYVSAALLARFESNATFPRLPFEPINKEKYDDLMFKVGLRRKSNDFQALFDARLNESTQGMAEPQDSACGDGFCAIK